MPVCRDCGDPDENKFGPNGFRKDGTPKFRPVCRACRAKREREWRRSNPETYRAIRLRSQYGLTPDEYEALAESQGGVCAICRQSCAEAERLSVDHDHATGRVRGLLCRSCNRALGWIDKPAWLAAALTYLENHAGR